jgi:exopolysaccharide production protein ExoQ
MTAGGNGQFPGSRIIARLPTLAIAYLLLVLPFLSDEAGGRLLNQLFWPVLAGIALSVLFTNRTLIDRRFFKSLPVLCLMAYMAFAAASVSWAFAPDYSFSRLIVQVMIIIVVMTPYALPIKTTHTFSDLQIIFALSLALGAVYVLTTKATPVGHAGYFYHKQEFGLFCATSIILSTHDVMLRKWRSLGACVMIGVAIWLLFESQSKSSLAYCLVAMSFAATALLACHYLRITPAVIVGAVVVISMNITNPLSRLSEYLYGDPTITARIYIWDFINYQISKKPWFGWGFHSYWFVPNSPHNEAWGFVKEMPSSHSGYMELKLETGSIGYWIFLAFLYASLHTLEQIRRHDPLRAWIFLSISTFALLINLVDSIWLVLNQLWLLYLIATAEAVRYANVSKAGTTRCARRVRYAACGHHPAFRSDSRQQR